MPKQITIALHYHSLKRIASDKIKHKNYGLKYNLDIYFLVEILLVLYSNSLFHIITNKIYNEIIHVSRVPLS